ncbi:cysteine dioxygenase [Sneathiella sp.]|uniref:cysteine dioxygenase family protein n=1 Tax=Sneathiella sp. TaxID=1964365 RepID=UPI0039E3D00E
MATTEQRRTRVKRSVDAIRNKIGTTTPDQAMLDFIRNELIELAAETDLFNLNAFPPPEPDSKRRNCLYRLSEDPDHRFALYANVAKGDVNAPPHDHTTWAVIVGITGQEENRFYHKRQDGVDLKGREIVEAGTGVTLHAEDVHSIHIADGDPVLNFHMYGLALEQLPNRNYWSEPAAEWRVFPAHTDIREAR